MNVTFLGVFFLGVLCGVSLLRGDRSFCLICLNFSSLDVDVVLVLFGRLAAVDIFLVSFFSLDCGGIFQPVELFPVVLDRFVVVEEISDDDLLLRSICSSAMGLLLVLGVS